MNMKDILENSGIGDAIRFLKRALGTEEKCPCCIGKSSSSSSSSSSSPSTPQCEDFAYTGVFLIFKNYNYYYDNRFAKIRYYSFSKLDGIYCEFDAETDEIPLPPCSCTSCYAGNSYKGENGYYVLHIQKKQPIEIDYDVAGVEIGQHLCDKVPTITYSRYFPKEYPADNLGRCCDPDTLRTIETNILLEVIYKITIVVTAHYYACAGSENPEPKTFTTTTCISSLNMYLDNSSLSVTANVPYKSEPPENAGYCTWSGGHINGREDDNFECEVAFNLLDCEQTVNFDVNYYEKDCTCTVTFYYKIKVIGPCGNEEYDRDSSVTFSYTGDQDISDIEFSSSTCCCPKINSMTVDILTEGDKSFDFGSVSMIDDNVKVIVDPTSGAVTIKGLKIRGDITPCHCDSRYYDAGTFIIKLMPDNCQVKAHFELIVYEEDPNGNGATIIGQYLSDYYDISCGSSSSSHVLTMEDLSVSSYYVPCCRKYELVYQYFGAAGLDCGEDLDFSREMTLKEGLLETNCPSSPGVTCPLTIKDYGVYVNPQAVCGSKEFYARIELYVRCVESNRIVAGKVTVEVNTDGVPEGILYDKTSHTYLVWNYVSSNDSSKEITIRPLDLSIILPNVNHFKILDVIIEEIQGRYSSPTAIASYTGYLHNELIGETYVPKLSGTRLTLADLGVNILDEYQYKIKIILVYDNRSSLL